MDYPKIGDRVEIQYAVDYPHDEKSWDGQAGEVRDVSKYTDTVHIKLDDGPEVVILSRHVCVIS